MKRIKSSDVIGKDSSGGVTKGDPYVSNKFPAKSKNEQALEESLGRFRYGKTGGEHSVRDEKNPDEKRVSEAFDSLTSSQKNGK